MGCWLNDIELERCLDEFLKQGEQELIQGEIQRDIDLAIARRSDSESFAMELYNELEIATQHRKHGN